MTELNQRIAGAPISWGLCEAPGWGPYQMQPHRILGEMQELGLTATEMGPPGFLPANPDHIIRRLRAFSLRMAGGFVPVVLHAANPQHAYQDALPAAQRIAAGGGHFLVLAAVSGKSGYNQRPELDRTQWDSLVSNLDKLTEWYQRDYGLTVVLHPHMGTVVEGPLEVRRVLDNSAALLCLDSGHLMAGGSAPVTLAQGCPERIGLVHAKDVRADLAEQVRSGSLTYDEAVRQGMYVPLGQGDAHIGTMVQALEEAGYTGLYVLEQDVMLTAEPPPDGGPRLAVAQSLEFLREQLEPAA